MTHPHVDHMGALTEILRSPGGIEIRTVWQSPMSDAQLDTDLNRRKPADAYLEALAASGLHVENLTEPGREMRLDGLHLKVLQVNDTATLVNAYNNASIVLRLWDKRKSLLMLGDTGEESGDGCCAASPGRSSTATISRWPTTGRWASAKSSTARSAFAPASGPRPCGSGTTMWAKATTRHG